VLTARWTVTDGTGQRSLAAEQATLTESVSGTPDGAVVAAMSQALEKLANRISAGIEPNLGQRRRSGLAFVPNLLTRQFPCVIEKKET
jgi:hypothetical protein